MICTSCGQKLTDKAAFCMKCGKATSPEVSNKNSQPSNLDQKWWLRLAKVLYIGLYVPSFVLMAVLVVLSLNVIRESLNSGDRGFSPFFAEGVTDLRIFIMVFAWVAVLRLMKIVFLYIALAQKPEWKKEFKKLF